MNLSKYKKAIRKAKRISWGVFCANIEDTSEASRLRKVLCSSPNIPSYLIKPDGNWTTSCKESLEILMDTHFPGSSSIIRHEEAFQEDSYTEVCTSDIISRDKILWAIQTFEPYKSPGPDNVIPAELQHTSEATIKWLEVIFKACIRLKCIPENWKKVRVVFIPKLGRSDHHNPNSLRPITLSSFLLKTLEKLIDLHLRYNIDKNLLSTSQHAYCKGKSTETALHSLVRSIEKSLEVKEYTLVSFLDIEGAFNNVETGAITDALADLGVEEQVMNWIAKMLSSRVISSELGGSNIQRSVCRGTPQGGVLSPLLWNLVVNKLLMKLEGRGCRVVAYADDVAVIISGKFPETLKELMQGALGVLSEWATSSGLKVNPQKTELVLFTRKHKVPDIIPPHLNGTRLVFSEQAKFLGIILDRKLSWKPNIEERVRKSTVALYMCKRTLGRAWGLSPRIMYWLYTCVIRPILMYGVVVWWPALNTGVNQKNIGKVQRSAAICVSGALRTTPSHALNILLHLVPLDILGRSMAASAAIRLKSISYWQRLPHGHSSILDIIGINPDITDYTLPTPSFKKVFQTIIPSRIGWSEDEVVKEDTIQFYTDGSKMNEKVGAGVYSQQLNINMAFRLPDHCSVFQAEVVAINEVMRLLRCSVVSVKEIDIYTDSQAAINSLAAFSGKSRVVANCRSSLEQMAEQFDIRLIWVPGHSDIQGNCRADELAKQGTSLSILPEMEELGIPIKTCKLLLHVEAIRRTNFRWSNETTCSKSRSIWPKLDFRRTKELLSLHRRDISTVVGVITGHCLIGSHARRLGVPANDYCRSCQNEEEEETIGHLLCTCSALMQRRKVHLGNFFFDELEDLAKTGIRDLQRFIKSSYWFVQSSD